MKRWGAGTIVLAVVLAWGTGNAAAQGSEADRWSFHRDELEFARLLHDLSGRHRPEPVAFVGVNVLPMNGQEAALDGTVLTADGAIVAMGARNELAVPAGYRVVEAQGAWLVPGLVDMHVHTTTTERDKLLNLLNGVTSVREMSGFPYMLEQRERIRAGDLLAPYPYVAGHILNSFPMGMFATVVETPEQGREAVRQQAAAGYDYIKIHNRVPEPVYRAIFDEAASAGLPVLGHVPHEISLALAVQLGHWTYEHLKGFILDSTLTLTDEDYLAVSRGHGLWQCPTLYTYRIGLTGDAALELIDRAPEMRFVSPREKRAWRRIATSGKNGSSYAKIYDLSRTLVRQLHTGTDTRFLVGTDSGGGYENLVPGFAVHEEMRLLADLALTPLEVLAAATSNAAGALLAPDIGAVEAGRRADLLLVASDPRESVAHLAEILGVMRGGVWLDRGALDAIEERIVAVYDDPWDTVPGPEQVSGLVAGMRALASDGWVFKSHHLAGLADVLASRGMEAEAREVRSWDVAR